MMKRMLAMLLVMVIMLGVVPALAEGTENPGSDLDEVNPLFAVIHNIAGEYAQVNFEDTAGNLSWILADMAVYEDLFPDSGNVLNDARKEEGMRAMVAFLATATKPGDLSKGILALRSLGYDARNIYTTEFEKLDAVAKLTELVDAEDTEVTNVYTLPYVILALGQDEGYATEEQMEWLIQRALDSKMLWQTTEDPEYGYVGTDAMTPMLLALAPYRDVNPEIEAAVNETVENLKAEQREDGLIDGYEGYEPASTGLAICGLSALGVDASTVTNGGENLIDGLLSAVNETQNGFANEFATEQGFRGLLAWRLLAEETGKTMYDFSGSTLEEANVSGADNCPVVFEVVPEIAEVVVEGMEPFRKNSFDLLEGTYAYTISATGYLPATGTVTVSAEEQEEHILKTIPVSLAKLQGVVGGLPSGASGGISGGGGGGFVKTEEPNQPEESIQPEKPTQPEEPAQHEKPEKIEVDYPDVKETDWYYKAVQFLTEKNLFQGTDVGFEPDAAMSRAMLVTVLYRLADSEDAERENPFVDVPEGQWYTEGIKWAAEMGIISGVSEKLFDPDAGITREQLALILYRYAVFCGYEIAGTDLVDFEDADCISDYAVDAIRYAVAQGILNGKTENTLAPKDGATRAEVATMLMRFTNLVRK